MGELRGEVWPEIRPRPQLGRAHVRARLEEQEREAKEPVEENERRDVETDAVEWTGIEVVAESLRGERDSDSEPRPRGPALEHEARGIPATLAPLPDTPAPTA